MSCNQIDRPTDGNVAASYHLRTPTSDDGAAVYDLIHRCPPLDLNSRYCYLLQCQHFADTCVLAERQNDVVGFISAYRVPGDTATLFVWQVAVSERSRGQGLAGKMLNHLLARPACADVCFVETTITDDNRPSWALFKALANRRASALARNLLFERQRHFDGHHASEYRVRIGPFTAGADDTTDPATTR